MPNLPPPAKQLAFHQLLVFARTTILHGALSEALAQVDANTVATEIVELSPEAARRVLAAAGIRDEHVFATPSILEARPTLLGYYRLLLGLPKKQFYTAETEMSRFKPMEERGHLRESLVPELADLCREMNAAMAEMITLLSPDVSRHDIDQLPLLTLGVQFDGGYRNGLGKAASESVFLAIRELVLDRITYETETKISLVNAPGRKIDIILGSDPDVSLMEEFGGVTRLNVAIEIKGGADRSNAHNRAGEAEKSHQKVRTVARDFWTLIAIKGEDQRQFSIESPTTRRWYDVAQVLARAGPHWDRFKADLFGAISI